LWRAKPEELRAIAFYFGVRQLRAIAFYLGTAPGLPEAQLLRGRVYDEQDDEQVCTGGSRAGSSDGAGSRGRASIPLGSDHIHSGEDRLLGHTLLEWVKKAEVDSGKRAGVPTEMADRLKALERENRELRQANEILRKASAYFAQAELDRPFKR
jgi:hypothetical protein